MLQAKRVHDFDEVQIVKIKGSRGNVDIYQMVAKITQDKTKKMRELRRERERLVLNRNGMKECVLLQKCWKEKRRKRQPEGFVMEMG